jgi:hypothetical protein
MVISATEKEEIADLVVSKLLEKLSCKNLDEPWIYIDDILKSRNVSQRTIYRKIKDGKIPAEKANGRYRIKKTDFRLCELRGLV